MVSPGLLAEELTCVVRDRQGWERREKHICTPSLTVAGAVRDKSKHSRPLRAINSAQSRVCVHALQRFCEGACRCQNPVFTQGNNTALVSSSPWYRSASPGPRVSVVAKQLGRIQAGELGHFVRLRADPRPGPGGEAAERRSLFRNLARSQRPGNQCGLLGLGAGCGSHMLSFVLTAPGRTL